MKLLTVQEVAGILSLHINQVYKLIASKELQSVRVATNAIRVQESALKAYIAERSTK